MENKFEELEKSIMNEDSEKIRVLWTTLSEYDKSLFTKKINNTVSELKRVISIKLWLTNSNLCKEIIGSKPTPSSLYVESRYFSAKEIINLCLSNVKMIPRIIMIIHSMPDCEKRFLLKEIEEENKYFYNSISLSLNKIETYISNIKKDEIKFSSKSPITFLCQYVQDKAEILNFYKESLLKKGLTEDEARTLIEIEARLLDVEKINEIRNSKTLM